jgi:mRNA interferase MazF
VQRGEIVWVNFAPAPNQPSHVQTWRRPAIICTDNGQNQQLATLTVVPGTTKLKALRFPSTFRVDPTQQNGLTEPTIFLACQVQTVDKRTVVGPVGQCDALTLEALATALKSTLGL